jgi:4'-phosphopantetheinyl transferase EntD
VIAEILPPSVIAEESFGDLPGTVLFEEEEAVIAKAVAKRRLEFTTARACARAALARLGLPAVPILPGAGGAPQWPAGVVGSITHCAGYRACAVARSSDVLAIGLDAEPNDKLPGRVLNVVSLAPERARIAELTAAEPGVCWDRLLFSAKESVYKAWFPLTGRWLGFEEAHVDFIPDGRTFRARLLVAGPVVNGQPLTQFTGRWAAGNGLIATAIAIPKS